MYCLDTYALVEISSGNPKFSFLLNGDFVIPDTTLAEFYWVLLRDKGEEDVNYWTNRLFSFCSDVKKSVMLNAQKFRYDNKKKNLSFFDCVGYIFALENRCSFVTGDKEFKNMKSVMHIQK